MKISELIAELEKAMAEHVDVPFFRGQCMRPHEMDRIRDCTQYADRFRAYYAREPVWGCLHIVLEERNLDDASVLHCAMRAIETGDQEAYELAGLLMRMSKTQRDKVGSLAECAHNGWTR